MQHLRWLHNVIYAHCIVNDNPIIELILTVLNGQLADVGLAGTVIVKAYQSVRQGVELSPGYTETKAAYLVKLYDKRDGFPEEDYVWDEVNQVETRTQTQVYHSTFQLTTLAVQTPGNTTQLTASDTANLISALLQNQETMALFQAQGVGILAITDIRNPYFLDDRDRYEASPSFDFTLVHKQVLTKSVPYSDTVTVTLLPVQ